MFNYGRFSCSHFVFQIQVLATFSVIKTKWTAMEPAVPETQYIIVNVK